MKKHPLLNAVRTTLFVITWIIIGWFLYKNAGSVSQFLQVKNAWYLVLVFVVLVLTFYFQLLARIVLANAFGLKISFKEHFSILSHNNILKYLPGGVWNQLDAALMMKKLNDKEISVKRTGKLVFVEMFWRVAWGYIYFGWIVEEELRYKIGSFQYHGSIRNYVIIVAAIIAGTYVLSKRYPGIYLYSFNNFVLEAVANFFFWLFSALEFSVMMLAFSTVAFTPWQLTYIGAANVVAWVIGFLVIPAPSGLGVREYVMGALLASLPGSGGIVAGVSLALVQRVMVMARDMGVYAAGIAYLKLQKK